MQAISPARVALTGAAGFLGRSVARVLAEHFPVRAFDVAPMPDLPDSHVGDVAELDDAMALCDGCSHLVISHMAPNRPEVYATPTLPFDVNVKGAANLLHAATVHGIRRVVIISSISVVQANQRAGDYLTRDLPPSPQSLYALTKTLQEEMARYYHRMHGLEIALLRPAYICDEDSVSDKYGRKAATVNWQFIDPRDIAEAARLALTVPKLGCEVFYLLGPAYADEHADVRHTREVLGWQPRHAFAQYPRDGEAPKP